MDERRALWYNNPCILVHEHTTKMQKPFIHSSVLLMFTVLMCCDFIDLNHEPAVSIVEANTSIEYTEEIVLHADAYDEDQDILSYVWFVDGTVQQGQGGSSFLFTPTHGIEKVYLIRVKVSDGQDADDDTVIITVTGPAGDNLAPVVSITEDDAAVANGEEIVIHAVGADQNDDDLTFSWLVDDALQSGETGTTFSFSATPTVEKSYTIRVQVSDGSLTAEDSVVITVEAPSGGNRAPTVDIAEANTTIEYGAVLVIHASAVDEDGDELPFIWLVDDAEQAGVTGVSFNFTAAPQTEQVYTVTVRVSDGSLSAEDEVVITVEASPNEAPTVTIVEDNQTIANGEALVVHATASDPEEDVLTYTWYVNAAPQFGEDGDSFAFSATPDIQFGYTVKVWVSDGHLTAEDSIIVTVRAPSDANRAPTVTITEEARTIANGAPLTIHAVGSDLDEDPLTFSWYVNAALQEGETGDSITFSAAPVNEQPYTVKVQVSDGSLTGSAEVVITVEGSVPVAQATGLYSYYGVWQAEPASPPDGCLGIVAYDQTIFANAVDGRLLYLEGDWKEHDAATPAGCISIGVHDGYLYSLAESGAFSYLEGTWRSTGIPDLPAAVSVASYRGYMYVLTEAGEIYFLEGNAWTKDDVMPPLGSVSLHADGENLLVVTEGGGLFRRMPAWLWFSESELIDIPPNGIGIALLNDVYYCLVVEEE